MMRKQDRQSSQNDVVKKHTKNNDSGRKHKQRRKDRGCK